MIAAVIAIALMSIVGYFAANVLVPMRGWPIRLLCLCVAPLVGITLFSLTSFFSALIFDGVSYEAILVHSILQVSILLTSIWAVANSANSSAEFRPMSLPKSGDWFAMVLGVLAVVSLSRSFVEFYMHVAENPHGWWDAKMIWNSRAQFLFYSEVGIQHPFTVDPFGHADYPLMLPFTVTQLWNYAGTENTIAPQIVGSIFYVSIIGVMISTLLVLRGWLAACTATIVLAETGLLAQQSAWQLADVPLAAFYVACIAFLTIANEIAEWKVRGLMLCGFFAGAAAWTKNEGIVFASITTLVVVAQNLIPKVSSSAKQGNRLRRLGAFCTGLALPILAVVLFKLLLAPPSDLADDQSLESITTKIVDISRYKTILQGAWLTLVYSQGSYLRALLWPGLFAVVLSLSFGARLSQLHRCGTPLGIVITMSLVYFVVYVISPRNLEWHVNTSITRLAIQLWPAWVFSVLILTPSASVRSEPATE